MCPAKFRSPIGRTIDSQATLWLYPLILLALFELVFYGRMGLRWTWGLCLQALAMLLVAVAGLASGHHLEGAVAGWFDRQSKNWSPSSELSPELRIAFRIQPSAGWHGAPDTVQAPDYSDYIARGGKILEHYRLVGDIVAPKRSCRATLTITIVITAASCSG